MPAVRPLTALLNAPLARFAGRFVFVSHEAG
jgi:hypothetical protein